MEKSQVVIDILAEYYTVPQEDVIELISYEGLVKAGYGEPAKKGVHAMHFPEDPGTYYIIKCRENECPICLG